MKITVSTKGKAWTDFEKREWKVADKEHYGKEVEWETKHYKISAFEGSKMIGNLRMDIRAGIAYVDAIIVSQEKRRQGIGKKLMEEAEKIARENGAHKIYLQTGLNWGTASFYKKLGYTQTNKLLDHYLHVDFIEMTKHL